MQNDAKQRVMLPKFNFSSTIKTPTAEQISCLPTLEEEGTEEFLEESDIEDENHAEETISENTPTICSITEKKKNSFHATGKETFTKTCLFNPVGTPLHHFAHHWSLLPR
jgi:hypothetical protein